MKKEPRFIVFNDIHIKNGNEDSVFKAVEFLVDHCNKLGLKEIVLNGDVFDSRSFQRLSFLKCFESILDLFEKNGIICHTVVGNHDKSIYSSKDNFIEPFKHHPSIKLYNELTNTVIGGLNVTLSPFFTDTILEEQLSSHKGNDLLIGHWACDGSTYLGKTEKNKAINKKLLSKWKMVYLGHYHNYHKVTENIVHLPSLIQDNFGEDNVKGFSVINSDLSYSLVKGCFKEFIKISIDLNKESIQSVKELIKVHKNSSNTVRFEFSGEESKLKSLDKSLFENTGIDFKLNYDKKYDFENIKKKLPKVIEHYTKSNIENEFKSFCLIKGYDYTLGKSLLQRFFKNK